jgi:hypothetical protein
VDDDLVGDLPHRREALGQVRGLVADDQVDGEQHGVLPRSTSVALRWHFARGTE